MEHSKITFENGVSELNMPIYPSQVSDKHRKLEEKFVKAHDFEDARKGEVREEHPDQISELPDAILVSILALLPFREVIRTSVLSRRWRYIWTLNPNLNLLATEILGKHIGCQSIRSQLSQELVQKYLKIVDQILHAYPMSKLNSLRLSCVQTALLGGHNNLCRSLTHVPASGVGKFGIRVPDQSSMPEEILFVFDPFPSATRHHLKYLHLHQFNLVVTDSLDCFRSLKTLNLEHVSMSNNELGRLLSNCVSLEWMRLSWHHSPKLIINSSSSKLKYLSLISCHALEEIEVRSKSLVTFELEGPHATLTVGDVPSVVDVWFHVLPQRFPSHFNYKPYILPTFTSQLQKLILTFHRLSKIPTLPLVLSTINVKVLVLNIYTYDCFDLRRVFRFVKNCPLVQELQFHLYWAFDHDDYDNGWYRRFTVGDHTLPSLKVVEISGFDGRKNQIDLATILFNHAVALELLVIHEARRKYLGEGKWLNSPRFNLDKGKIWRARRLLFHLAPPNVQLVYNSSDE